MLPNFTRNCVPPDWILELKPGEYEIKDLIKLTGFSGNSITARLKKYGATIKKVPSYHNLYKNVFIWEGLEWPPKKKKKATQE
jgi:hypothetical protein